MIVAETAKKLKNLYEAVGGIPKENSTEPIKLALYLLFKAPEFKIFDEKDMLEVIKGKVAEYIRWKTKRELTPETFEAIDDLCKYLYSISNPEFLSTQRKLFEQAVEVVFYEMMNKEK